MNSILLKLYVRMQSLLVREEGQDLVEYALCVALIAMGATVAMQNLGSGLNNVFSAVSSTLSNSLT
jgi:pilus assembly protein Flp/PilA